MEPNRQTRLEAAGWKVSTVDEFLGFSPAESENLDVVFAVAGVLRQARKRTGLTGGGGSASHTARRKT